MTSPTTPVGTTPTHDLKGGDYVQIGGRVREVFDTIPTTAGGTIVRWLDDDGEVHNLRTFVRDTLVRLPYQCHLFSTTNA